MEVEQNLQFGDGLYEKLFLINKVLLKSSYFWPSLADLIVVALLENKKFV
jgi:hypothetical protein